eukprot:TCALIF_06374-PA protein Name:"Similar to Hr39 Nuclear hormone receptor FTZ-F1 beta (Drosophila melanogaster)" AED:0.57 eAED:0.57 QI:0/0/0/0.5/1/1/2/0/509
MLKDDSYDSDAQLLVDDDEPRKAVRVCPVCGQVTKYNQLKNYGAYSCFSCRAFFRRSHENTRNPDFICRKNGECDIQLNKRKKCRKCRYDRCVEIGMRQDRILDDSAKKKRFKNFRNWRKRKPDSQEDIGENHLMKSIPLVEELSMSVSPGLERASRPSPPLMESANPPPDWFKWLGCSRHHAMVGRDANQSESRPSFCESQANSKKSDIYLNVPRSTALRAGIDPVNEFSHNQLVVDMLAARQSESQRRSPLAEKPIHYEQESHIRIRTDLGLHKLSGCPPSLRKSKINLIGEDYDRTMFNIDLHDLVLDQVKNIDGDVRLSTLDSSKMKHVVKIVKSQYYRFAFGLETFANLDKSDQVTLLNENSYLFIQLLLAKAVVAENGIQQINYLVGVTSQSKGHCIKKVSFQDVCSMTNLFNGNVSLELEYLKLIGKLRRMRLFSQKLSILAYLIVFHVLPTDVFCQEGLILSGVQDVVELIQEEDNQTKPEDVLQFFSLLLDMRRLLPTLS